MLGKGRGRVPSDMQEKVTYVVIDGPARRSGYYDVLFLRIPIDAGCGYFSW